MAICVQGNPVFLCVFGAGNGVHEDFMPSTVPEACAMGYSIAKDVAGFITITAVHWDVENARRFQ